jgi:hypothetical protein
MYVIRPGVRGAFPYSRTTAKQTDARHLRAAMCTTRNWPFEKGFAAHDGLSL